MCLNSGKAMGLWCVAEGTRVCLVVIDVVAARV